MKKHKIYTLLDTFTKVERRKFLDFVRSPYFNKRQSVVIFAAYLLEKKTESSSDKSILRQIPVEVFRPGEKNKKALSYLNSELYRLAKQFLAIQFVNKQNRLIEYYTSQEVAQKDKKVALKILTEIYSDLQDKRQLNQDEMLLQFLVVESLRELYPINGKASESLLQASINSSEEYYLFNKVSLAWEIENRKVIVKHTDVFQNPLMGVIENYLEKQVDLNPLTLVYFQLYLATKDTKDKANFNKLLKILRDNNDKIDTDELRNIYLATINILMRKMRSEPSIYTSLTLEFYTEGIKNETLLSNGFLSQWTYKNIVKLGIHLNKFDWVELFINNHLSYLPSKERDNAFYSNTAELQFAKGDYDQALDFLNKLRTNNFRYYLSTKILRIKIFYEKGDMIAFESNISTFLIYLLRRKDLAIEVRENCQNFCTMVQRIVNMNTNHKKIKTGEKLATIQPIAEKEWLLSVYERESKRMYT